MKNTKHEDLDATLDLIEKIGRYGNRDRALYFLRTFMRSKDIAHLRSIDQVMDRNFEIRKIIIGAEQNPIQLPPRARTEIAKYLLSRFGSLENADRNEGLFPTEKNPYGATMRTLPQLYWSIDKKLREYSQIPNNNNVITGTSEQYIPAATVEHKHHQSIAYQQVNVIGQDAQHDDKVPAKGNIYFRTLWRRLIAVF